MSADGLILIELKECMMKESMIIIIIITVTTFFGCDGKTINIEKDKSTIDNSQISSKSIDNTKAGKEEEKLQVEEKKTENINSDKDNDNIENANKIEDDNKQNLEKVNKNDQKSSITSDIIFREPFKLRLRINQEQVYEQEFEDKMPYVAKGYVYIFSNEEFGINLALKDGQITEITYQNDINKADITFKMYNELVKGKIMMYLKVTNNTESELEYKAMMVVLNRERPVKTSVINVLPKIMSFESWPHPIIQLILFDFKLIKK